MEQDLIRLAKEQIEWEQNAIDSIDAKATGLLAFDGALAAGILLLNPRTNAFELSTLIVLALSAIACVVALWPDRFDFGPDARSVYAYVRETLEREQAYSRSRAQELSDLALLSQLTDAVEANRGPFATKSLTWRVAAALLLLGVILMICWTFLGKGR